MEQTWNKKAINKHFEQLERIDLLNTILGLKSEGKNIINILNQKTLAKSLKG